MKLQRKRDYFGYIKSLLVMMAILAGTMFLQGESVDAASKSFRSSDSKTEYVQATIKNNKLNVVGKTTQGSKTIKYSLYYYGNGNSGSSKVNPPVKVANKQFSFTADIVTAYGAKSDGMYELVIDNGNKSTVAWIVMKNKVADFYEADCLKTDKLSFAFLSELDRKQLLKSTADDTTTSSPSSMSMTAAQKNTIKNQAVTLTKNVSGDYNKVKAIYTWITNNIYYDVASADQMYGNGNNNPYVVLKNRYGVCEGYARLMNEMLRSINIPAVYVGGAAQDAPISSKYGAGHAWIAVYADGRWFYCDPTWDTQNKYSNNKKIKGKTSFSYFDLTVQAIGQNHRVERLEAKRSVNDFDVTFDNGHVSAGDYQGNNAQIIYPSKIGKLPITQVIGINLSVSNENKDFYASFNEKVTSITIPSSYTTLANWAFQHYNALEKIVVEDNITQIGEDVLQNSEERATIYGPSGCSMESYAKKNNLKFTSNADKKSISNVSISGIKSSTYTGKSITQSDLIVKFGTKKLVKDKDYKLTYKNNKNIGQATVIITGKGCYTGTITKTFNINPQKVTVTSVKNLKGNKLKIIVKKSAGISGYQVVYSTDKNFKSNTVKKDTKSTSLTVSNLKKGKTYYVKVRAFKKDTKGNTTYGAYSSVKKLKVTK